jgi:hypothetical protein
MSQDVVTRFVDLRVVLRIEHLPLQGTGAGFTRPHCDRHSPLTLGISARLLNPTLPYPMTIQRHRAGRGAHRHGSCPQTTGTRVMEEKETAPGSGVAGVSVGQCTVSRKSFADKELLRLLNVVTIETTFEQLRRSPGDA